MIAQGRVLIFANQIQTCENLAKTLQENLRMDCHVLHGDKLQQERTQIINEFKKNEHGILIATDVASRGLDIPQIKYVINYETPKDGDTHIHRVGRTGRAGNRDGVAVTLIMRDDTRFAPVLIKNLEISGQLVPAELEAIAMDDDRFRQHRMMTKFGLKKG
jgi:ATP-dependent RNA helicase DDX42